MYSVQAAAEIHYTIPQNHAIKRFTFCSERSKSNIFCSWSGGKDSTFALYKVIQTGNQPSYLLTMMIETGDRSRSHGIPKNVLQEQASCLGLPIRFCATSWQSYTENFRRELHSFKEAALDIGIFGDIDVEGHLEWVQTVCRDEEVEAWLPLWHSDRAALIHDMLEAGFRIEIVVVKDGVLSENFLGRVLDKDLVKEFEAIGIDLCGENGEYHTIVTDGPIFHRPLNIQHGQRVLRDGYWFSDVSLEEDLTEI